MRRHSTKWRRLLFLAVGMVGVVLLTSLGGGASAGPETGSGVPLPSGPPPAQFLSTARFTTDEPMTNGSAAAGLILSLKSPAGLDSVLYQMERVCEAQGVDAAQAFAFSRGLTLLGGDVRVIVEAEPGRARDARVAVSACGGGLIDGYEEYLSAWLPLGTLESLLEEPGVLRITPDVSLVPADPLWSEAAHRARPTSSPAADKTPGGSIISEGVAETHADVWHAAGYRGRGLKIGIVDVGFAGYSELLGTELPSSVEVWRPQATASTENHGTMVAQVVHDMAPEAGLFLAETRTRVETGRAVDWLLQQGVRVINYSCSNAGEGLGDGRGPYNDIVTRAVDHGVFWAQSAGNYRKSHWMGDFTDPDHDNWLNWDGLQGSPPQTIWVPEGRRISAALVWDDAWSGATQDYDLYLYRWDGEYRLVAESTNRQNGTAAACPAEEIDYMAPSSGVYVWSIWRYSATRTDVDFDFLTTTDYLDDGYGGSYFDYARSIAIPADNRSAGFMAVAAVGRGPDFAQEFYSSEGPTRDGRIAPEIAGPCGVQTSIGNFPGTSAAAPHVAGAAALVRQAFPAFSPAQVEDYLKANAMDLGDPGPDNQYGYGLLRLPAPPASADGFVDVPPGHPYASAIAELSARNIIGGYDKNHFGPEDAVMRQQFAKMIVRSLGLEPLPAEQCPFKDVDSGWPYPRGYIATVAQRGITTGTAPGSFAPWDNIGRAQVVTMVVRALDNLRPGLLAAAPLGFTASLGDFSPTHAPAMAKAESNGLLAGLIGFGPSWDPWKNATRGEVAQMLWNALRLLR